MPFWRSCQRMPPQTRGGGFIEHVAVLRQCPLAKVSASVQLMTFQQELQHTLTLSDIEGACRMSEEGSAQVTKLSAIGCDIEDIRHVAFSYFLYFILVLATSGLASKEDQQRPAEQSPTKIAMASIIECLQNIPSTQLFLLGELATQRWKTYTGLAPTQLTLPRGRAS